MAEWKTPDHLRDHFGRHRGELRVRSIAEYDASAQETIVLGVRFTYSDIITGERRTGYYHRDSARFVGCDSNGYIVTHHVRDEDSIYNLPRSTYWEE